MGLPVIDVAHMASASHVSVPCNVYPIQLELPGTSIAISVDRVLGVQLAPLGLLLLIGRDVLQPGTLFYNGTTGQIAFAV